VSSEKESVRTKVSVKIVTYNHEPFIAQTLDSVLMQKVDFPNEIVVVEDCSTTRTLEILQERIEEERGLLRKARVLQFKENLINFFPPLYSAYRFVRDGQTNLSQEPFKE